MKPDDWTTAMQNEAKSVTDEAWSQDTLRASSYNPSILSFSFSLMSLTLVLVMWTTLFLLYPHLFNGTNGLSLTMLVTAIACLLAFALGNAKCTPGAVSAAYVLAPLLTTVLFSALQLGPTYGFLDMGTVISLFSHVGQGETALQHLDVMMLFGFLARAAIGFIGASLGRNIAFRHYEVVS